ncbi:hypothetical protein MUK42_05792 [Musa troglodytarum]|uniref:Elongator complex protein 5 n=1 Tax=Musa troglodytarum TaxID=320322 RepID=A0A9E7KAX7_9LILI|nr:hypothetical protein MUK42_05792 [Musa troglodytarum]
MAELIARSLGDGCLEGEHAPSRFPCLRPLRHQPRRFGGRCVESKPSSYFDLLRRKGVDASVVDKSVRILDCYSDPLGWKDCVPPLETARNSSIKENNTFVRDGLVGKARIDLQSRLTWYVQNVVFAVAHLVTIRLQACLITFVPMVNMMHQANTYKCILVSNFCIFWLIHSDLHEPRFMRVSTMVASVQPIMQCTNRQTSPSNLLWLEKSSHKEKFHVRLKCHNGRAKLLVSSLLCFGICSC